MIENLTECHYGIVFQKEVSVIMKKMSRTLKFLQLDILRNILDYEGVLWNGNSSFRAQLKLVFRKYRLHAFLQVFFHYGFYNYLCNWIPQGMRDRGSADTNFGSNILFLPALEVKLDDLHVYRLQGLQGDVLTSPTNSSQSDTPPKTSHFLVKLKTLCYKLLFSIKRILYGFRVSS